MNSYQKLKKKNQELTNDIITLVSDSSGFLNKAEVTMKWVTKLNHEKMIMSGSPGFTIKELNEFVKEANEHDKKHRKTKD